MEINKINNFVCVSYGEKGTRRYRIIEEDDADDISEIDVNARYKWSWSWLEGEVMFPGFSLLTRGGQGDPPYQTLSPLSFC